MSHNLPSGVASGFFPTEVIGHFRPTAQIIQWNIAAPNPSGGRHIESGAYKKTAHVANRGGFTAQMESGAAIDFGDLQIPGDGSGFESKTVALTFSMGELNKNINSRFDQLFNDGSGTGTENLTAFNFRMWIGNLNAFDMLAYSGINKDEIKINPIFHFQQSAQWRQSYNLPINQAISGVEIMPSSMPNCPNIFSREDDISASGAYKDREFTNFIYVKGEFPTLPVGTFYKLGTYGGLGLDAFTVKFSYDYSSFDANIINPTDLKDFSFSVDNSPIISTASEGISGWWLFDEASPKLSQVSGFTIADGYTSSEINMTLEQNREGGGNIGRHTGLIASGTSSGWAMDLRSDRKDQVFTANGPATTDFNGTKGDGNVGFTFTGWLTANDPSGVDPNVGVGSRPPWKHTGLLCRWDSGLTFAGQYTASYNADLNRFLFQINNNLGTKPFLTYSCLNVDSQDNGHGGPGGAGTFADFGAASGGGGLAKHMWYFIALGYDPTPYQGSPNGHIFMRVNDGPIEILPAGGSAQSLRDAETRPFSIGNGATKANLFNGGIGPGAGQYDNWILHRGKVLNNQEMVDLYNSGSGIQFPAQETRQIDFSLPPVDAANPNPVPLRRSLRAWYNFSEPSGTDRLADSQRYWDIIETGTTGSSGFPVGIQATSGIIVNEFPTFSDITEASGALQIRKVGGAGFRDGQPGNGKIWETDSTQVGIFGYIPYTIAAWVKFPAAGSTENIAGIWNSSSNDRHWLLQKQSSDSIAFFRANGVAAGSQGIALGADFENAFTTDRWYFVYIQYEVISPSPTGRLTIAAIDSVTGQGFTNSQENTFQWNTSFPDSTIPFNFGSADAVGGGAPADIDIAAFGLWYRKLPQNEIDQLNNNGNGLNFGAPNFDKVNRVYWDSQLKRDNDPSTL